MHEALKQWALTWFRPSRREDVRGNVRVTLVQSLVFWLVFLGAFPLAIHTLEARFSLPTFAPAAGDGWPWLVFAAAGSLGLFSGTTMARQGRGTPLPLDCPRRLVVEGPYRFVRNPMAVAGITQAIAVGLALGSPLTIVYSLAGAWLWNTAVRPIEEADLERRFGEDFVAYREAVRCWLPRWAPYPPES